MIRTLPVPLTHTCDTLRCILVDLIHIATASDDHHRYACTRHLDLLTWSMMICLLLLCIVNITLVILPSFKFMIISSLHLLSLVIHVIIQPYITARLNRMELLTLVSLTLLSLILATFPDTKDIDRYASVRIMIITTILVPVTVFAVYTILYMRYMIMKHGARLCCCVARSNNSNNNGHGSVINDDNDDDAQPPAAHDDGEDGNHHHHHHALVRHHGDSDNGAPLLAVHHT